MIAVEFDHKIGDRVKVKCIEMVGSVDALCLDICGKQYRIVFWNNGDRKSLWLYDWEIEPCANTDKK